jgi:hypothetical protein
MAGIGATLETSHGRITSGKDIHDLTFTFISPLETKDYVKFRTHI